MSYLTRHATRSFLLCFCVLILWPSVAAAQDKDETATERIFLDVLSTDLHRKLLRANHDESAIFVTVDATSDLLPGEDMLKCDQFFPELKSKLESLAGLEKDTVYFCLHCCSSETFQSANAIQTLGYALTGFGYSSGFEKARFTVANHNGPVDMNQLMLTDIEFPELGEEEAVERATQVGVVQVYPVKTRLSRILTGNCDCIIFIDDEGIVDGRVAKAVAEDIATAFEEMEIHKISNKVILSASFPDSDRAALVRELDDLAKSVGFKTSTVQFR